MSDDKKDEVAAVPVLAQQASSASPTQAPEVVEAEEAVEREPVSLEDAASAVVLYVRAHRTIGDADLASAIADVEAALLAQAAAEDAQDVQ